MNCDNKIIEKPLALSIKGANEYAADGNVLVNLNISFFLTKEQFNRLYEADKRSMTFEDLERAVKGRITP